METKVKGKAWMFGDFLDVDYDICPVSATRVLREKKLPETKENLAQFCLTTVDPDFPNKVNKGDFIVAGENMGYGHDHYACCMAILGCGVAAVLCDSTNANFFRNSVEHGLPVIECPGIHAATEEGDELEVDLKTGVIKNLTRNTNFHFEPYPDRLLSYIEQDGLYALLKNEM
jgi:3-isopropylmalate dehydratase, small subunit